MKQYHQKFPLLVFLLLLFIPAIYSQTIRREFKLRNGGTVEVINHFGRVEASVAAAVNTDENAAEEAEIADAPVIVAVNSTAFVAEDDIKIDDSAASIKIDVKPDDRKKRIDLSLVLPAGTRLKIETLDGEVRASGDLELIEVKTDTGTIAADVPTRDVKYQLFWTESRPRVVSDFELEKVQEKAAGRFQIKGRFREAVPEKEKANGSAGDIEPPVDVSEPPASAGGASAANSLKDRDKDQKPKSKVKKPKPLSLDLTTARGIILLNVPPSEVMSDLRERPLTLAAKSIVRSGDSLLMEAIRRAAPKYYGDYARSLPPAKIEPSFAEKAEGTDNPVANIKQASVRVTDLNNRAVAGLKLSDFELTENNAAREIISVQPATAPFNLVLLLDVSGSVDNYVNFIRKAARSFVNTVDDGDRVSIVTFNEDVKVLSGFTSDKRQLSESLDTFDAGGGTAFYDSIAYTLTDTLRPLKGERTAIVVLTDGDDNRSFLAFDSLLGSIQESGALIYPLYIPSALIAASESANANAGVDPLRSRYMSLTSKAAGEGDKLAKISGGVYYPITQISQIQRAYDDIVVQLRTAYTVTFRSELRETGNKGTSPRVKVKVKRENAFASVSQIIGVN